MLILVIEDSRPDEAVIRRVLKMAIPDCRIIVRRDGQSGLDYLQSNEEKPDLVILDLHLPQKTGHEILETAKQLPGVRQIPIIVWTSSLDGDDVYLSYDLQASSVLAKPGGVEELGNLVAAFKSYWAKVVKLPPKGEVDENSVN